MTNTNDEINLDAYTPTAMLPKLAADMIKGEKTVLTVRQAREGSGPYGPYLLVVFEEFPEHCYITNKTQGFALMNAVRAGELPKKVAEWAGYRIPFRKQQNENPTDGTRIDKLYAMDAHLWKGMLADFDAASEAMAAPTPAPKRKGRRPSA